MKKMISYVFAAALLATTLLTACNKNTDAPMNKRSAKLTLRLADAPAQYQAVYVDIQKVEVNIDDLGWYAIIPAHSTIFNLMDFRNGIDALLCEADIPAGHMSQIRVVLGSQNSVVIKDASYPLSTPSAMQSGLKLKVSQQLNADSSYTVWLDFDAQKSIVENGKNDYSLKPVIRTYNQLTDGRIKGYLLPLSTYSSVEAILGADTFRTIPAKDGRYMLCGLPEGNYTVRFEGAVGSTLSTSIVTNVAVKYGLIKDLGTITLLP